MIYRKWKITLCLVNLNHRMMIFLQNRKNQIESIYRMKPEIINLSWDLAIIKMIKIVKILQKIYKIFQTKFEILRNLFKQILLYQDLFKFLKLIWISHFLTNANSLLPSSSHLDMIIMALSIILQITPLIILVILIKMKLKIISHHRMKAR